MLPQRHPRSRYHPRTTSLISNTAPSATSTLSRFRSYYFIDSVDKFLPDQKVSKKNNEIIRKRKEPTVSRQALKDDLQLRLHLRATPSLQTSLLIQTGSLVASFVALFISVRLRTTTFFHRWGIGFVWVWIENKGVFFTLDWLVHEINLPFVFVEKCQWYPRP